VLLILLHEELIDQLPVVINFDLPNIPETYATNWSNWTCWKWWYCISFCSKDEHTYWKDIQNYKSRCKTVNDHQYHWHSGSPELPAGSAKKIQTEGRTQIKKIEVSKQNKKRWY
jgi:ATP-dependent RNA helicase RhlE